MVPAIGIEPAKDERQTYFWEQQVQKEHDRTQTCATRARQPRSGWAIASDLLLPEDWTVDRGDTLRAICVPETTLPYS
jgi:hypothetical protein